MSLKESSSQTLRLTQTSFGEEHYRFEIALEGDGNLRRIVTSEFSFRLTAQDQEDIRWYLEDYLQYPLDPAPKIAARIEGQMAEIGRGLFKNIFHYSDDTQKLWFAVCDKLCETRVTILTEVQEATAIPWELMRDPTTDTPLALRARAFVRASRQAAQTPRLPVAESGPIRILLVICRPGGRDDVPFRSVASRLIRGIDEAARQAFQLDVLRPPTFEALAEKLSDAKEAGKPYHVVHFDGHGSYLKEKGSEGKTINRGYIYFERYSRLLGIDAEKRNGVELGKLLVENQVSLLVLNACQSAYVEAPEKPQEIKDQEGEFNPVRAFGSFAQEVISEGVAGVVAMRYNVYVVTASQFIANLYSALANGQTLGQAVSLGRRQLAAQPLREIAYDRQPLQDWCVPVIYEVVPIALFPGPQEKEKGCNELKLEGRSTTKGCDLDPTLPPSLDVGFFGRDETLLALDRAFDTQSIVLLHAYAGSGKTVTAAEFARWYALTGGLGAKGLVLFTSFERYRPLARVLNQLETIYERIRLPDQLPWLTLDDAQRRDLTFQILSQLPVLWIWDNVEPVTGFPSGTESAWSEDEQKELVDFLRAACDTKAKFLLTSRRDEHAWLGDLSARVALPPMPMQERVQLARALAEKYNRCLTDVSDWHPLLRYTQGNPLTITVIVGQALHTGLKTRDEIEAFVEKLRSGEAEFEDDKRQGRSQSLEASLHYGFDHAFTEEEHRILALLYLFQGFVDVDVLTWMGKPEQWMCKAGQEWNLPELRDLTHEACISLLDRAVEVGLLTKHGKGSYSIHPAVPWIFKDFFDNFYPNSPDQKSESPARRATRAFASSLGALGIYYHAKYQRGHRDVIDALVVEEINLLHAHWLACVNGWREAIICTMQGLSLLYNHTGRRAEWKQRVEEIVPKFVDLETDSPLQRWGEEWVVVTEYRVEIARRERKWKEAEHLQQLVVEWTRKRAASAIRIPLDSLNDVQRNTIRSLGVSLELMGRIQKDLGRRECVRSFKEALECHKRIADKTAAASCARNLGQAYENLPALRDFGQAEGWYRRSLELYDQGDQEGRGRCIVQLGTLALKRHDEAKDAKMQGDELRCYLNEALRYYHEALVLLPTNAVDDLAVTHHQLGFVYGELSELERALHHCGKSIQYEETMGDLFEAARTRLNVAFFLARADCFTDALLYARAALRNYETYGELATQKIQEAKRMIAQIEEQMKT